MSKYLILSSLLLLLSLCGCSSGRVSTERAPNTDFASYRTYDWYIDRRSTQPVETLMDSNVRSAIATELSKRGFKRDPTGNPDFLIAYNVSTNIELSTLPGDYGPTWGGTDIEGYRQGSLIVDFIDPDSNKGFWRGIATQVIGSQPEQTPSDLRKSTAQLFEKYPYS